MKSGTGKFLVMLGVLTTIIGVAGKSGDQYKEEMFFNGIYGSEKINEVHSVMVIGVIMIIIGVLFMIARNLENDETSHKDENQSLKNQKITTEGIQGNSEIIDSISEITPLLRRAEIFLEDGEFDSADEYYNRVLDIDPECSKAYIGRLLVELNLRSEDELAGSGVSITEYGNYRKAVRFAKGIYKEMLEKFDTEVQQKKEIEHKEIIYNKAIELMVSETNPQNLDEAAKLFRSIKDYKDSERLSDECVELIENFRLVEKEKAEKHEQEELAEMQELKKIAIRSLGLIGATVAIFLVINIVSSFKF